MSEQQYPDLLLPPFWGNSDILAYEPSVITDSKEVADQLDPRALYCYFPVIIENGALVLLDPYDQSTEVATLKFTKEYEHIVNYFRPDTDVCAISAFTPGFSFPQSEADSLFNALRTRTNQEIKRGLQLDKIRGKAMELSGDMLESPLQLITIAEAMSVEDRLGFTDEHYGKLVQFSFHFHNVRDE